jgi:transposase
MIAYGTAPDKPPSVITQNPRCKASFASPPWNDDDPRWLEIDARIGENHLARQIDAAVDRLDLSELLASYSGRGSKPLHPRLMLKMVLYQMASGKPSPAEWFRDTRESDPVKWIARGSQPARSVCYDYWNRIARFVEDWSKQVLREAGEQQLLCGDRVAQDGTAIAANASRHRMVREETLLRRAQELDAAIAADKQQSPAANAPRWMAKQPETRLLQRDRYRRAEEQMRQLQAENRQRRACKRQDSKKIVVSTSDPDAVASRDKLHVFRPLYNVQLLRDVDSQFIMAYQVYNRNHDSGRLAPLVERCMELTGRKPNAALVDSSYLSVLELAACDRLGITLYGPIGSNDYTEANEREPQTNNKTKLPKRRFTWLPEEQAYVCPKNHRLELVKQGTMKRHGQQQLRTQVFQCAAEVCAACSLRLRCTPQSKAGRTITRIEHEELADALRKRMDIAENKAIYKLRGPTIEQPFAEVKEHRGSRRFCRRGLRMAQAQTAALVLCRNLLALHRGQANPDSANPTTRIMQKMLC